MSYRKHDSNLIAYGYKICQEPNKQNKCTLNKKLSLHSDASFDKYNIQVYSSISKYWFFTDLFDPDNHTFGFARH